MILAAIAVPVVLAAGCKEEPKKVVQPTFDLASQARQVVEQNLRSAASVPAVVELRGVQIYPQAMPRHIAVCGQISLSRHNAFTFFVSVATYEERAGSSVPTFHVEQYVADTIDAATRVWTEMIGHCYENGGPQLGNRPSIPTLPPMPNMLSQRVPQAEPVAETPQRQMPQQPSIKPPEVEGAMVQREPSMPPEPSLDRTAPPDPVVQRRNGILQSMPGGTPWW